MEEKMAGEPTNELVHVIVLDRDTCRSGLLNEDIATTLVAVASEDPADWNEMLAYWPRYSSRVVPEFLSSLPLEIISPENLNGVVSDSQLWIVLDLVKKRFLSGKSFHLIQRDACFAMHTDENGDQHDPLSVHLPPWWELDEQVEFEVINKPRQMAIEFPRIDREYLFGDPMVQAIADHALKLMSEGRLTEAVESSESTTRDPYYALTLEVHRDWLMTPRENLGGLYPRQMLHGGMDWIDQLAWGQRLRFDSRGSVGQIVAAPKDCFGYKHGPMGREEMAIYFDLCRELIEASWYWCQHNFAELNRPTANMTELEFQVSSDPTASETNRFDVSDVTNTRATLIGFLNEVKLNWLTSPFEGGSAPAFILECSRRRVPRGAGVEIVGMDQRQSAEHIIDCDCPICIMMAEGKMGVGFCSIDGHHLELDGEFAFSMHETREAWEAEQQEYAEFSAKCDREREERQQQGETKEDEFASAWSGSVSAEPIPGDTNGDLKLAFLLAELVTEIKQASNSGESSPTVLVKKINADFARFRASNRDERLANAKSLTNTLEQISEAHPELVSRTADFQSRIVESARRPIHEPDSMDGDDIPF